MTETVNDLSEFKTLINKIFQPIVKSWDGRPIVVLLSGDLGAGKTTGTQELAKLFHVEQQIKSPTFIYVDEHKFQQGQTLGTFYHWDLWRLNPQEFGLLRMDEKLEHNTVHAIEWWKRCQNDVEALLSKANAIVVSTDLAEVADRETARVVQWQISNQ